MAKSFFLHICNIIRTFASKLVAYGIKQRNNTHIVEILEKALAFILAIET